MTNCCKQLATVLIFLFIAFHSSAQTQQTQQPKRLEANYVHDRMYDLMAKSKSVELPASVTAQLETINKDNPYKQKYISGQSSLLKVMYNTSLTKDDHTFFGKQLLENSNALFLPIHSLVKEKMKKL